MKLIDILVEELPKRGGWPEGVCEISTHASGRAFFDGRFAPRGFSLPMSSDAWNKYKHPRSYTNAVTREQYEAALAAKNDGWIEWDGGECPVSDSTIVEVRYRKGEVKAAAPADFYEWGHGRPHFVATGRDIIAYRLHQPQKVEQAEADDEVYLNECIGQDAAPVWNGDGLPPVGCECEWQDKNTKQWNPVKVVYASEWVTVIREINKEKGDDLVEIAIENYGDDARLKFRPTRSEAERKREKAVQALCNAGGGNGKVDEKAGYGSCWFDVYDAIAAGKIPGVKLDD